MFRYNVRFTFVLCFGWLALIAPSADASLDGEKAARACLLLNQSSDSHTKSAWSFRGAVKKLGPKAFSRWPHKTAKNTLAILATAVDGSRLAFDARGRLHRLMGADQGAVVVSASLDYLQSLKGQDPNALPSMIQEVERTATTGRETLMTQRIRLAMHEEHQGEVKGSQLLVLCQRLQALGVDGSRLKPSALRELTQRGYVVVADQPLWSLLPKVGKSVEDPLAGDRGFLVLTAEGTLRLMYDLVDGQLHELGLNVTPAQAARLFPGNSLSSAISQALGR